MKLTVFQLGGQDFRVDYLYIGDFIKNIQEKKNNEETNSLYLVLQQPQKTSHSRY